MIGVQTEGLDVCIISACVFAAVTVMFRSINDSIDRTTEPVALTRLKKLQDHSQEEYYSTNSA